MCVQREVLRNVIRRDVDWYVTHLVCCIELLVEGKGMVEVQSTSVVGPLPLGFREGRCAVVLAVRISS